MGLGFTLHEMILIGEGGSGLFRKLRASSRGRMGSAVAIRVTHDNAFSLFCYFAVQYYKENDQNGPSCTRVRTIWSFV